MQSTFDYGYASVRDLQVNGVRKQKNGKMTMSQIAVDGRPATPTKRFWRSFFTRFGIAENVFRYFEPDEVFTRIAERAGDEPFRYCLETDAKNRHRLLAISSVKRPIISHQEVCDVVTRYGGRDAKYQEGIVATTHSPPSGERTIEIGGDHFRHRFVLETPVDGFGHPRIYLSFLRLICENGAVGYSRAFRSEISLGKDIAHCIGRALDSYDNGDGYAALRQRFASAQTSWASVHECLRLYRILSQISDARQTTRQSLISDFTKMTGNLNAMYGLANLDALSDKRQRILPSRCRVYDLINFASEVGTHHATVVGNRSLQAFVGSLISDEYDMEGTAETATDFSDFFVREESPGPRRSLN